MADKKFSDFTAVTTPDSTILLAGLQGGDNMKMNPELICYQKKINITSPEVLNIFSSPKVLIAAPGSGLMIRPIKFMILLTYNSVAYASNTQFKCMQGSFTWFTSTDMLPAVSNRMTFQEPASGSLGSPDLVNANLILTSNTGNPTAGNSVYDVYVTYQILKI